MIVRAKEQVLQQVREAKQSEACKQNKITYQPAFLVSSLQYLGSLSCTTKVHYVCHIAIICIKEQQLFNLCSYSFVLNTSHDKSLACLLIQCDLYSRRKNKSEIIKFFRYRAGSQANMTAMHEGQFRPGPTGQQKENMMVALAILRAPTTLAGYTRYQINTILQIFLSCPLVIKYAIKGVEEGLIVCNFPEEPEFCAC